MWEDHGRTRDGIAVRSAFDNFERSAFEKVGQECDGVELPHSAVSDVDQPDNTALLCPSPTHSLIHVYCPASCYSMSTSSYPPEGL